MEEGPWKRNRFSPLRPQQASPNRPQQASPKSKTLPAKYFRFGRSSHRCYSSHRRGSVSLPSALLLRHISASPQSAAVSRRRASGHRQQPSLHLVVTRHRPVWSSSPAPHLAVSTVRSRRRASAATGQQQSPQQSIVAVAISSPIHLVVGVSISPSPTRLLFPFRIFTVGNLGI
ncbi:hypothetical protein ACLOJK_037735 [Asimina triloba]